MKSSVLIIFIFITINFGCSQVNKFQNSSENSNQSKILFTNQSTFKISSITSDKITPEFLFQQFDQNEFIIPEGIVEDNGWIMKYQQNEYSRSTLQLQASEVVKFGIKSFNIALKKLDDPKNYIRYIASETLRQLTNLNPPWYTFHEPQNTEWSMYAKSTWTLWYKENKINYND